MKKRLIILTVLVVAAIVAALVCPHEPRYQGRSLTGWLQMADDMERTNPAPLGTMREPQLALRHIGAAAVPHLLRMARARDSGWQHTVEKWLGVIPYDW